jgi:hypothetical protein
MTSMLQHCPAIPMTGTRLGTVIPHMQAFIGNALDRCITDAGYRGHNACPITFKVYTTGPEAPRNAADQARVQTAGAIEPVIRHLTGTSPHGPQSPCQAVLAAGHNFRRYSRG